MQCRLKGLVISVPEQMDIEDNLISLNPDEISEVYEIRTASNSAYKIVFKSNKIYLYKPASGEQPLWDFPAGSLMYRELLAYHLFKFLGVKVPKTKIWQDGPIGPGMLQEWITTSVDEEIIRVTDMDINLDSAWLVSYLGIDGQGKSVKLWHKADAELRAIAFSDLVMNNADRKASHVLHSEGSFYAIDHGLCFHAEDKLRSIFWGWAGEEFSQQENQLLASVKLYLADLPILNLINKDEVSALQERVDQLQRLGRFPNAPTHRSALPWPVY